MATSLPPSLDLSHHLSHLARSRLQSPLKGLYKYFNRPGILMLAGGLPSPSYFPFEDISATTLGSGTYSGKEEGVGSWLLSLVGLEQTKKREGRITIPKFVDDPSAIQLATALQYGLSSGLPALSTFINEFTSLVFIPGYSDWQTILNAGSTDAWVKIVTTLCDEGDGVLCEEWTYPSALAAAWPSGIKPVAVPMDGGGITVEGLDSVLREWNEEERGGMKRPRVLYTVPVCQNPTGSTMTAEKKQEIYKVCVEFDVIIVEDDPYYFLQAGEYSPISLRAKGGKKETDKEFLDSLIPSYLRFDYQGRVVRIDTFSKTIAPGSRLGWITTNPIFIERLARANESSTQSASGFSQAIVGKLLVDQWGMKGWLGWLKGLKAEYKTRRDLLVDSLVEKGSAVLDARESVFPGAVEKSWELFVPSRRMRDEKGFLISDEKVEKELALLSFVAPMGGMFVWLRVHTTNHPSYPKVSSSFLISKLWEDIAEAGVLIAPGNMFSGREFGKDLLVEEVGGGGDDDGFFRLSFSTASEEEMGKAATVIKDCTQEFWEKRF